MAFEEIHAHYKKEAGFHHDKNPLCASIEENLHPHLTGDVLTGPDRIEYRSSTLFLIDDSFLQNFNDLTSENLEGKNNFSYTFFRLGSYLSGHPNIVHGGLLATLLDELTCRLGFQNYESKRAVTANLNINYFQPCMTDSYVMIKCTVLSKSGRKCMVRGEVFKLDSGVQEVETKANLLTSCECLIVEPRSWS